MKKTTAIAALALIVVSCVHRAHAQTAVFPGAIATDANLKVGINGFSTLLTVSANISQTTMTISSCSGLGANMLITIDSEILPVTGCSGTVLVVGSRGFDGTNAAAHAAGTTIYAFVDAWHHNALRVEIEAIEAALGVSLANVLLPGQAVSSFNTRQGAVTLQSSDVSAVEQDLRTSASPTFSGLTATGAISVDGSGGGGYAGTFTSDGVLPGVHISSGSGLALNTQTTGTNSAHFLDANGLCVLNSNQGLVCANVAVAITDCQGTNSCSATNVNTNYKVVFGAAILDGGSPSKAAVTAISPAFSSTGTYYCTVSEEAVGLLVSPISVHKVSGSAVTFTGANADTGFVDYVCFGQ